MYAAAVCINVAVLPSVTIRTWHGSRRRLRTLSGILQKQAHWSPPPGPPYFVFVAYLRVRRATWWIRPEALGVQHCPNCPAILAVQYSFLPLQHHSLPPLSAAITKATPFVLPSLRRSPFKVVNMLGAPRSLVLNLLLLQNVANFAPGVAAITVDWSSVGAFMRLNHCDSSLSNPPLLFLLRRFSLTPSPTGCRLGQVRRFHHRLRSHVLLHGQLDRTDTRHLAGTSTRRAILLVGGRRSLGYHDRLLALHGRHDV